MTKRSWLTYDYEQIQQSRAMIEKSRKLLQETDHLVRPLQGRGDPEPESY